MANVFYGKDLMKGYSRRKLFEDLMEFVENPDVEKDTSRMIAALRHEVEMLDRSKALANREPKDPLKSPYALSIKEVFVPLLTSNPSTLTQLLERCSTLSSSGKPYSQAWVARVLNSLAEKGEISKTFVIAVCTNKEGLECQKKVVAYFI